MLPQEIIRKKRDGQKLSAGEIHEFITGVTSKQVSEGQVAAFCMATLLKGMDIPKTGQGNSVGIMVTKTMLVAGESQVTSPQGRGRGARLVAYDKKDGHELGSVLMPAAISGSPMTYSVNGRQYIIVGVSGGNYTGEYIAYALPQSELPRR